MKNSKYVLLVIGILGLAAGVMGLIEGQEVSQYMLGLICGSSLVWGYFELKKAENKE